MRLTVPDKKALMETAEKVSMDYSRHHTISQLAALANMSSSRFKKGFRCLFGKSFYQYILHKKMAYARERILEDELTLAQIAKRCGYRYTTNFIAAFKKLYGYTPARLKPENEQQR